MQELRRWLRLRNELSRLLKCCHRLRRLRYWLNISLAIRLLHVDLCYSAGSIQDIKWIAWHKYPFCLSLYHHVTTPRRASANWCGELRY